MVNDMANPTTSTVTVAITAPALYKNMMALEFMARAVPKAWDNVHPEFGAYMWYSKWLEEGTVKMAARPHIVPAVKSAMSSIVASLAADARKILFDVWFGMSSSWNIHAVQLKLEAAWVRALNDKPRQFATGRPQCPVLYGFHRRSIRGYAQKPDITKISRLREKAWKKYHE